MRVGKRKEQRGKDGFTLVELLVVVSILLVLSALALPALQSARSKAERVACLNNQRSIHTAWTLFQNDHGGNLPSNGYAPIGGDPMERLWVQGYLNPRVAPQDVVNTDLLVERSYSQLADYISNPSIYKCPADDGRVEINGEERSAVRSYSMNAHVGWQGMPRRPLVPGSLVFRSTTDVSSFGPAKLMVLLDVNPAGICWPFFGVSAAKGGHEEMFAFPAAQHDRGAMVLFADGHIEHHVWRDPRTYAPGNVLFHSHDTPSPGNPDVTWLQEHAGVR